jgi:integrase
MATGIVKRHSRRCRSRAGGGCNCKPSYEAWVSVRQKKVRKTFRREAEAKTWRADALAAANKGSLRPARRDTRTVGQALEEFTDGMRSGAVRPKNRPAYKPNTIRSYERAVRNYIKESPLGDLRVTDTQRPDVQALVDDLLAQGLNGSTVSNILNPVQAFYRRAMDRNELAYNPAERLDIPVNGSKRPRRIVPADEAARMVAVLPDEDLALRATAFYAGLRRGELQGLRVCDVDLGASEIRVERGWDQEEGDIEPKSEASKRTVPLLAVLRDYLDEHLLRVERRGEELVFGRTGADPFVPSTIDNRAQECWAAIDLEPITLHECRHTFASLLIDAGANPKAIQTFMGHSKIQTTFDTYGHLMPGSRDEVRERMDAYLDRSPSEIRPPTSVIGSD